MWRRQCYLVCTHFYSIENLAALLLKTPLIILLAFLIIPITRKKRSVSNPQPWSFLVLYYQELHIFTESWSSWCKHLSSSDKVILNSVFPWGYSVLYTYLISKYFSTTDSLKKKMTVLKVDQEIILTQTTLFYKRACSMHLEILKLISHGNANAWELYFHSFRVHIKAWPAQNSFQNSFFFAIHIAKFLRLANSLPHMCSMYVYIIKIFLCISYSSQHKIKRNRREQEKQKPQK